MRAGSDRALKRAGSVQEGGDVELKQRVGKESVGVSFLNKSHRGCYASAMTLFSLSALTGPHCSFHGPATGCRYSRFSEALGCISPGLVTGYSGTSLPAILPRRFKVSQGKG